MEEKKSLFSSELGKIPVLMIVIVLGVLVIGGFLLFRNRNSADNQVAEVAQNATTTLQTIVPEDSSELVSPSSEPVSADSGFEGTYTASIVTRRENKAVNLELYGVNTAVLTEYDNDTDKVATQTGTWSTDSEGYLIVTLTEKDGSAHVSPDVLTFRKTGTRLEAVTYEADLWGSDGLIFEKKT